MKSKNPQSSIRLVPLMFFSMLLATRTIGGLIAVGDGSIIPSDSGCTLSFAYNQADNERLVVLDETNHRRYEAKLKEPGRAPFWESGKIYVIHPSGIMQEFLVQSNKLNQSKEETIADGAIFWSEYVRSQHRLYLITTKWDTNQKGFAHNLVAIDFPARKTIWTERLEEAGILGTSEKFVCVMGERQVQIFDSETGQKKRGQLSPSAL